MEARSEGMAMRDVLRRLEDPGRCLPAIKESAEDRIVERRVARGDDGTFVVELDKDGEQWMVYGPPDEERPHELRVRVEGDSDAFASYKHILYALQMSSLWDRAVEHAGHIDAEFEVFVRRPVWSLRDQKKWGR